MMYVAGPTKEIYRLERCSENLRLAMLAIRLSKCLDSQLRHWVTFRVRFSTLNSSGTRQKRWQAS